MTLEYELVRSRRRSLELRVYPDQRIEVRAPMRCPQRDIDAFLRERQGWLEKRLKQFSVQPAAQAPADGIQCYVLGETLTLKVEAGRRAAERQDNLLLLYCLAPDDPDSVARALQRWLRQQAETLFAERLALQFAPFRARGHGVPPLKIRTMRSRWGSMSKHSGMTLNLALMHAPVECLDYVIVHELCHLEHMNHGPHFKRLMTGMMPDWQERRRRLNSTAWSHTGRY